MGAILVVKGDEVVKVVIDLEGREKRKKRSVFSKPAGIGEEISVTLYIPSALRLSCGVSNADRRGADGGGKAGPDN